MRGGNPNPITTARAAVLGCFCGATVLLIPFRARIDPVFLWPGALLWIAGLTVALKQPDGSFRRRMAVLFLCVAVLAAAPIHTNTDTRHFVTLGAFFLAVVAGPTLALRKSDPGVITWNLFPTRFRRRDLVYVLISIPLSWLAFRVYFFTVNPEVPAHWVLPAVPDREAIWRLIAGINGVGIWDELFFINTVYGLLRSLFSQRVANAAQAVVYASVLNTMAFTGIGPLLVYALALTQGSMYEGSRSLLYVILVHLIIDLFLVRAILQFYYPGMPLGLF